MFIARLKERIYKNNMARNSLIIMFGQSIASVISFFNMFLILKGVGIYGQGIIAIVQSYSNIFNGIFNFQSYNAMVKYGAEALEKNDKYKFKQYMKQAFIQDLITAFLAYIVAIFCVSLISQFMKWDNEIVYYVKIFLVTIPFNVSGSINAFLRLNDEFKIGALISIRVALIKMFLLIVSLYLKLHLIWFIYIEIGTTILNNIMFFYFGYKSLRKNELDDFWKVKIRFDKEFTMFNFYNNIVSTIDMPTGTLVNLIINKMLGVNEVGIYNVLVKLGSLITKVTDPIAQSLLPELSKLVAKNDNNTAHKLVKKIFTVTLIGGCCVIILSSITSPIWLGLVLDVSIFNIFLICIYFAYITLISALSGVHLLFISLNLVKYNVGITLICNIVYLLILYVLSITLGLVGIIISLIIQAIMIALIKYIFMRRIVYSK